MKIILSFVLLLIFNPLILAEELSTLAEIRMECENQSILANHPFYPDSVWKGWINQACMDLSNYGIIEKFDTIYWISGTMIYSCNADFLDLIALFFLKPSDGKNPLDFIAPTDVMKLRRSVTQPISFWQSGEGSSAKIGFYPIPVLVDTLLLIYGAKAKNLSTDTSTTDIPYSYRTLILDYVIYRALLREGKNRWREYYENYKNNLMLKLQTDKKKYDILIPPQQIDK